MKVRHAILVVLAAAAMLAVAAAAVADAPRQRVAIVGYGGSANPSGARFSLTPLQAGALEGDSLTGTAVVGEARVVRRGGQEVSVYDSIIQRFKGKRGTLVIRSRIESVDAGRGYHVGTSTWKVVRGTGQYAGVAGGGRGGHVWLDSGPWSGRIEGFLTRR